jgi:hypothetical protein
MPSPSVNANRSAPTGPHVGTVGWVEHDKVVGSAVTSLGRTSARIALPHLSTLAVADESLTLSTRFAPSVSWSEVHDARSRVVFVLPVQLGRRVPITVVRPDGSFAPWTFRPRPKDTQRLLDALAACGWMWDEPPTVDGAAYLFPALEPIPGSAWRYRQRAR